MSASTCARAPTSPSGRGGSAAACRSCREDVALDEVLALRAAVKRVLHAAVAGPAGRPRRSRGSTPPPGPCRSSPSSAAGGSCSSRWRDADPLGELLARVAVSAMELAEHGIGFCDAPGCGQFFASDRANQKWCSNHCGTRARVARHAARA